MAAHDDLVALSAAMSGTATALIKIANDLRHLGSGPRCGLAELRLPDDGLTSSIMPGKRNATLAEALVQVCHLVLGNHLTVELAGASGSFELNVAKPVIAHAVLQSIEILADAARLFGQEFVLHLEANEEHLERNVSMSLMLATGLTPRLGYDAVTRITELAERENLSVEEATLRLGLLDRRELKEALDPRQMVSQRGAPALNGDQAGAGMTAHEDAARTEE
jgi:fumarate hydratase class II